MVKNLRTYSIPVLLLGIVFLFCGCRVDLLGLFGSTDLSKRLDAKNNFTFLNRAGAPALDLTAASYSFIVVSDTHIEDGDAFGLENLKDVVAANSEIKFVAVTGDITQNAAEKDILKFIEIADSLGVPCYPAIGNHDIYFGNWSSWKELIGSTMYRRDSGNTTLIVLDTANAYLGKDQLDWLDRELRSSGSRTFVFTHTNLFVENPLELQQLTDTTERARFISILRGRCDYVFTGHLHERIIKEAGGVTCISLEDFRRQSVYCLVSVSPGGISYKFEKL